MIVTVSVGEVGGSGAGSRLDFSCVRGGWTFGCCLPAVLGCSRTSDPTSSPKARSCPIWELETRQVRVKHFVFLSLTSQRTVVKGNNPSFPWHFPSVKLKCNSCRVCNPVLRIVENSLDQILWRESKQDKLKIPPRHVINNVKILCSDLKWFSNIKKKEFWCTSTLPPSPRSWMNMQEYTNRTALGPHPSVLFAFAFGHEGAELYQDDFAEESVAPKSSTSRCFRFFKCHYISVYVSASPETTAGYMRLQLLLLTLRDFVGIKKWLLV